MQHRTSGANVPWWRFGYVWMVLAGPAVVVVASFVTFYLALTRPDPLVTEDYYRKGIEINNTMTREAEASAASLAPAVQARNHAATGVVPATKAINPP